MLIPVIKHYKFISGRFSCEDFDYYCSIGENPKNVFYQLGFQNRSTEYSPWQVFLLNDQSNTVRIYADRETYHEAKEFYKRLKQELNRGWAPDVFPFKLKTLNLINQLYTQLTT